MIKIKGVRIELDSIENCLLSFPGIIQVASKGIEDAKGNKRLATYYVIDKEHDVQVSDLRKHLAEKLPAHFLPHYLIHLNEMPTTENGKVAFDRLPLPKLVRPPLSNRFVPPKGEIEKEMLGIWEELLGIKGIGVTDDFFEVGGDSLLGVLLFVSVEKEFQRTLPVSTLLKAPTIRELSEILLNKDKSKDFTPIIPVNTSGDHIPIFFIPGKGGYPTRIRHLAKQIDPQTPVYALQDLLKRRDGGENQSVESSASLFLNEIKKLYANGPYILVGESLGGKIAFEMAQQLMNKGEKEPILIMLDTYNYEDSPMDELKKKGDFVYYKMLVQKHLSIIFRSNWQGKLDYFRFYRENFTEKVAKFIYFRIHREQSVNKSALPKDVQSMETNRRSAIKAYDVKSYPGQVILVRAALGPNAKDPTNGWDKVKLGELIVHTLDCYHGSILFEPAVSQLADIIQDYIEKVNSPLH